MAPLARGNIRLVGCGGARVQPAAALAPAADPAADPVVIGF